jgi:hypothetical protein
MIISDRDPDWTRVRQACPVRKGYISVGRGFVGHGTRAEAHLIEGSRGKAPSDRTEIRKRGKTRENKGKTRAGLRRRASMSSVSSLLPLSPPSSRLCMSIPPTCSLASSPSNTTQRHPPAPLRTLISLPSHPAHLSPSHPIPSPIPSSRLTSFPSLLSLRPRHTDTDTDIRQRQCMARGTAHDAAARRKTWQQGRHGTRVDVDVSGARSGRGR